MPLRALLLCVAVCLWLPLRARAQDPAAPPPSTGAVSQPLDEVPVAPAFAAQPWALPSATAPQPYLLGRADQLRLQIASLSQEETAMRAYDRPRRRAKIVLSFIGGSACLGGSLITLAFALILRAFEYQEDDAMGGFVAGTVALGITSASLFAVAIYTVRHHPYREQILAHVEARTQAQRELQELERPRAALELSANSLRLRF